MKNIANLGGVAKARQRRNTSRGTLPVLPNPALSAPLPNVAPLLPLAQDPGGSSPSSPPAVDPGRSPPSSPLADEVDPSVLGGLDPSVLEGLNLSAKSSRSPPKSLRSSPKSSTAHTFEVVRSKKYKQGADRFSEMVVEFNAYMETSCRGIIDKMWSVASFYFQINFWDLRRRNKDLAYKLVNEYEPPMFNALRDAAKEFVRQQFRAKNHVARPRRFSNEELDIRIEDLSLSLKMPHSIQSLESFLDENKSSTRTLFARHPKCRCKVAEMHPAARRILRRVIDYTLIEHGGGRTWEGDWELEDWDVFNGADVFNVREPYQKKFYDPTSFNKDHQKIESKIIPKLEVLLQSAAPGTVPNSSAPVERLMPSYLGHLSSELKRPPELGSNDYTGWYMEYLQYHPALLTPKARMNLIYGFYHVTVHLQYMWDSDHRTLFWDESTFKDWAKSMYDLEADIHGVLWGVFWNNDPPDLSTSSDSWKKRYESTTCDLLQLIRHLVEHAFNYAKWCGAQTIKSDDECDLFAAREFPEFLPMFIKLLFLHKKMVGEFRGHYDIYKATREV